MVYDIFILILVTAALVVLLATIGVALGIVCASAVRQGFRTAAAAIERFFGPGCKVTAEGHRVTVRQIVPVLELATARGEFDHSFTWKRAAARFLGIPVPFTAREALCTHDYVAKAGFDLKTHSCSFEFVPRRQGLLASVFGHMKYAAVVTIPEPRILSVETVHLNIVDRYSGFWNRLSEADRNTVSSGMLAATREHVRKSGCQLFEISKGKLESGLRAVLPPCVEAIEFRWIPGDDSDTGSNPE